MRLSKTFFFSIVMHRKIVTDVKTDKKIPVKKNGCACQVKGGGVPKCRVKAVTMEIMKACQIVCSKCRSDNGKSGGQNRSTASIKIRDTLLC